MGVLLKGLFLGGAAGIVASALTAPVDKTLKRLVSEKQRRREKEVREGSPHEIAGVKLGERLVGRELVHGEKNIARAIFSVAYGVGWGLVYLGLRKIVPKVSRFGGLGYALGFYLACDGLIAPAARIGPQLNRIPWQFNVKEFLNHVVWTATAEAVIRRATKPEKSHQVIDHAA